MQIAIDDAMVASFDRDGFVVLPRLVPDATVQAVLGRFEPLFAHQWATGVGPDEVNYDAGVTPPDRTRQLCNAWRADPVVRALTCSAVIGAVVGRLARLDGVRLLQDNVLWKPPGGTAIGAHQDNSYNGWLDPVNMTTCWMALDDTAADAGTIWYVRGSHRWPRQPQLDNFHAPTDWLANARSSAPPGVRLEDRLVPVEVPAGGAAVHHGWTFHGSPPNTTPGRQRRSVVSHFGWHATRHHPTERHPIYSRYRDPGSPALPDEHFPLVWRADISASHERS